jgi:hypothetical protein
MRGLSEWGGPAQCSDELAIAMGFAGVQDLSGQADRLRDALNKQAPLRSSDWRRTLVATEIVFASDVFGSGVDWATTTGLSDEKTIRLLREVQRKVGAALARSVRGP